MPLVMLAGPCWSLHTSWTEMHALLKSMYTDLVASGCNASGREKGGRQVDVQAVSNETGCKAASSCTCLGSVKGAMQIMPRCSA